MLASHNEVKSLAFGVSGFVIGFVNGTHVL